MSARIAILVTALMAGALLAATLSVPRCKPGDPGVYVANMLVAGCPR